MKEVLNYFSVTVTKIGTFDVVYSSFTHQCAAREPLVAGCHLRSALVQPTSSRRSRDKTPPRPHQGPCLAACCWIARHHLECQGSVPVQRNNKKNQPRLHETKATLRRLRFSTQTVESLPVLLLRWLHERHQSAASRSRDPAHGGRTNAATDIINTRVLSRCGKRAGVTRRINEPSTQ